MTRWLTCLLLLAAACARESGGWPSLAPRPAELRRLDAGSMASAKSAVAPIQEPPPPPAIPADAAAPADWAKLKLRLPAVTASLARALSAARGKRSGSEAWAAAQIELSRAEQLHGDLADVASRFGENGGRSRAPADLIAARADLARQLDAAKAALAR